MNDYYNNIELLIDQFYALSNYGNLLLYTGKLSREKLFYEFCSLSTTHESFLHETLEVPTFRLAYRIPQK